MSRIFRILTALCLCLVLNVPLPAGADENTGPLAFFLNKLESYQADFKQTIINEQGVVLETSTGKVYMQNPGRYRWEYEHPYEQFTIRNVAGVIDNTPAAIISGQQDIDKYFVVVNMGVIEGFDFIELTPRDLESQYRSVRLGFDKNNLVMMIMHDNLGQITRIDFLHPERNRRFGGPLFTFDPPEGVDVIDERQTGQPVPPGKPAADPG